MRLVLEIKGEVKTTWQIEYPLFGQFLKPEEKLKIREKHCAAILLMAREQSINLIRFLDESQFSFYFQTKARTQPINVSDFITSNNSVKPEARKFVRLVQDPEREITLRLHIEHANVKRLPITFYDPDTGKLKTK